MKNKIKEGSIRFAILFSLVLLVAFLPSGAGGINKKMSTQQMQDSINYYRNNTLINYELIKKRIQ